MSGKKEPSTLILVNGKIGCGSPRAGPCFWHASRDQLSGFVHGALEWFGAMEPAFPVVDFSAFSQVNERFRQGYFYWRHHARRSYPRIHVLTHSMGAAFGEGLLKAAAEMGYKPGWVVHVNPYQAKGLSVSSERVATVDYQFTDDPLINNRILKAFGHARPGLVTGASYPVRLRSGIGNPLKRHRGFIRSWGYHFWPHLYKLLNQ